MRALGAAYQTVPRALKAPLRSRNKLRREPLSPVVNPLPWILLTAENQAENSHFRPLAYLKPAHQLMQKFLCTSNGLKLAFSFHSRRSVAVKWTLFNASGLGAPLRVRPIPHGPVWPSDLPLGGEREELRRAKSLAGANPFLCCRSPVSATQSVKGNGEKPPAAERRIRGEPL